MYAAIHNNLTSKPHKTSLSAYPAATPKPPQRGRQKPPDPATPYPPPIQQKALNPYQVWLLPDGFVAAIRQFHLGPSHGRQPQPRRQPPGPPPSQGHFEIGQRPLHRVQPLRRVIVGAVSQPQPFSWSPATSFFTGCSSSAPNASNPWRPRCCRRWRDMCSVRYPPVAGGGDLPVARAPFR